MRKFLSFAFLSLFFLSPLFAQEPKEVPDVLDFDLRQSGLYRFELSPYGGDYFRDKFGHSFIVGGNLQANLTEKLGVSADFGYSTVAADPSSIIGATITNSNEYLVDGGLTYTVPAAYRSGKGYTEADFFTSLGGGIIRINGENRGGGYIGGGMKIRPHVRWFAIRVEIRNYFTSVNNPSGSNFEDDLNIRIGPTFLLPPEF